MAVDRWLLEQHSQNPDLPSVLRFYNWSPAAISLGYHQRHQPEHWAEIAKTSGLDIVRRPSGGRAVLHQGDLTYSLVTRANLGTRAQTYRTICEFLIQGLAALGVDLNYGEAGRGYIHNPSCFSISTDADLIVADRRKLIGSAQVYRKESVLQHGSISIQPDYELLRQLFGHDVAIVGLSELLIDRNILGLTAQLIQVLTTAAAKCFDTEFNIQPLSAAELSAIEANH